MNKKVLAAATAALLTIPSAAVFGADVMNGRSPYMTAPPPIASYNWIGPYIGINLGYEWANATNSGASPNGFAGGFQGGYNWQINQIVYGFEGDLQATGADDTFANWKFYNPWFGTLRGRVGYAMNNILFYGTLGMAYGGGKVRGPFGSDSNTHLGWTAGAGIEVGLAPNWSAKAEYLYVDLTNQDYILYGNTGFEANVLRFGLNYRF
jgi:outer membrane immunogenic protein